MDLRYAQEHEALIYWSRMPMIQRLRLSWKVLATFVLAAAFFSVWFLFPIVCVALMIVRVVLGAKIPDFTAPDDDVIRMYDEMGAAALGLKRGGGLRFFGVFVAGIALVLCREWWTQISPWAHRGQAEGRVRRAARYQAELHQARYRGQAAISRVRVATRDERVIELQQWIGAAEPSFLAESACMGDDGSASVLTRPRNDDEWRWSSSLPTERKPCLWVVLPDGQAARSDLVQSAVEESLRKQDLGGAHAAGRLRVHVVVFDEATHLKRETRLQSGVSVIDAPELLLLMAGESIWGQRDAVMTRHSLPWIEAISILRTGQSSTEGFDCVSSDRLSATPRKSAADAA